MKHLTTVVALFVACGLIRAAVPEFELSSGDTGGRLTWLSHTFTPDGDFLIPNEDYVIEIPEQGVVSICLRWMTDPAKVSGGFLDARGAWRIPKAALTAPRYRFLPVFAVRLPPIILAILPVICIPGTGPRKSSLPIPTPLWRRIL